MAIHTLRPSGDYSAPFNATTIVGAATGWQAVNESSPDEDTSYVTTTGIYFATVLPNTMPTATINSVKVVVRARHDGTASTIILRYMTIHLVLHIQLNLDLLQLQVPM